MQCASRCFSKHPPQIFKMFGRRAIRFRRLNQRGFGRKQFALGNLKLLQGLGAIPRRFHLRRSAALFMNRFAFAVTVTFSAFKFRSFASRRCTVSSAADGAEFVR